MPTLSNTDLADRSRHAGPLRQDAARGVKWLAASQAFRQVTQILTTAILARLLSVSDFGLVGMATVVIGFVGLFRDLGTSAAAVQKKDASNEFLSTIFWANFGMGLIALTAVCSTAGIAATVFQEERIRNLLIVLSFTFPLSSLGITHQALLTRSLAYGKIAVAEMLAVGTGSVLGIASALAGAGVWALVYRSLAVALFTTVFLWVFSGWLPRVLFRKKDIREVFSYSLHLTGFNVVNYFIRNADYILVGRYLGAESLGYYTLAYTMLLFPIRNISAVIGRVVFPLYSRIQEDNLRLRRAHLQVVSAIALATFPMMLGLMVLREPFVQVVLGEAWEPTIPLILFLAPVGLIQSIGTTLGTLYQAKGRTDLLLYWGLGAGCLILAAFAAGLQWGITGVAAAYMTVTFLLFYPGHALALSLIELPVSRELSALMKPLLSSGVMAGVVYVTHRLLSAGFPGWFDLSVSVFVGCVFYGVVVWKVDRDHVVLLLSLARGEERTR